jgi:hypothetical protein
MNDLSTPQLPSLQLWISTVGKEKRSRGRGGATTIVSTIEVDCGIVGICEYIPCCAVFSIAEPPRPHLVELVHHQLVLARGRCLTHAKNQIASGEYTKALTFLKPRREVIRDLLDTLERIPIGILEGGTQQMLELDNVGQININRIIIVPALGFLTSFVQTQNIRGRAE